MSLTPRNALASILALIGNVNHATRSGPNDAEARGHLLNSIREIVQAVPPATTAEPEALAASLRAMVDYYDHDLSESGISGPGGSPAREARALLATSNDVLVRFAGANLDTLKANADLVGVACETPRFVVDGFEHADTENANQMHWTDCASGPWQVFDPEAQRYVSPPISDLTVALRVARHYNRAVAAATFTGKEG